MEYVEAEDEFDIKEKLAQAQQPAAAAAASKAPVAATPGTLAAGAAGGGSGASEGEDVDVLTRTVAVEYSSDAEDAGCDGDDGPLLWLPAVRTVALGLLCWRRVLRDREGHTCVLPARTRAHVYVCALHAREIQ